MSEVVPAPDSKHPHLHAVGHALATAGEVYGQVLASLLTSQHHPSWEQAVKEYDRTHPAGPAADGGASR